LIEIACGPISEPEVADEIPFVCSLFLEAGAPQVSVVYGVGCNTDHIELWSPLYIPATELLRWIAQAAQRGIYKAGRFDIFIDAGDQLTVRLCHEGDIHVSARSASIFEKFASRWVDKEYRLLRNDVLPPGRASWREINSIEEATAGF
jgi:hypothetical protein